jgi:hypothetical protein
LNKITRLVAISKCGSILSRLTFLSDSLRIVAKPPGSPHSFQSFN